MSHNDTRERHSVSALYSMDPTWTTFPYLVQALLDLQGMSYIVLTTVAIRNDVDWKQSERIQYIQHGKMRAENGW